MSQGVPSNAEPMTDISGIQDDPGEESANNTSSLTTNMTPRNKKIKTIAGFQKKN
jgi:hypothetical protein